MTALRGSCYPDVWRALVRLLGDALWPPGVLAGAKPLKVAGCYLPKDVGGEWCLVETEPSELTQDLVALAERAADETHLTDVLIASELKHPTWQAATDRLQQLTLVVEQVIAANGRPTPPAELGSAFMWWQVVRIRPQVVATADGAFAAGARITIQTKTRLRPV